MITTLIICFTVVLCLFIILKWAHDMSTAELPMFTYGECVKTELPDSTPSVSPIGFKAPEDEQNKENTDKEKTDKEVKEAVFKDPITMTAALLRGEVDIDDITN